MALSRKITRYTLALAACVALVGSTPAFSDPLFAGITSIEALGYTKSGSSQNEQVIRLNADLPFQYSVHVLNDNQVAITLKNARLADNIISNSGILNISAGGAVTTATLGMAQNVTEEQIVLNGPGLGKKRIVVEGPTLQSTSASTAKAEKARVFAPPQNNPNTPAYFSATGMPDKPSWYQTDPNRYSPEPDPDNPNGPNRGGFLGLFKQENTDNPTVASNKPSKFSFFGIVKNRPATDHDVEQNLVQRIHTPVAPLRRPVQPPPQYHNDEAVTVMAVAPEATPQRPLVQIPAQNTTPTMPERQVTQRIDTDSAVTDFRMNAASAAQRTVQDNRGPQIQSVSNMPYRNPQPQTQAASPYIYGNLPPRTVTPWGNTSYQQQQQQQQEDEYEIIEEIITQPAAAPQPPQQPAAYQMAKALPRYEGGSPPIQFTVSGYGANSQQVYTLPSGNAGPNNDPAIAALAYGNSDEQVNVLMKKSLDNFKTGNYSDARTQVERALKLDDQNAELYAALSEIELKQNRFEEAEQAYSKAVALDAKKSGPRYAQILILAGDRGKAMNLLKDMAKDPAVNDTDKSKVHYMLGTLYQENGEMLEAIGHLQAAARLSPKNADIQYNLGLAYEFQGDLQQAKTHYNKAVQLNPKAEDAKKALARTSNALRKS